MKYVSFIFIILLAVSCKKPAENTSYLGVVNISITGKEKALPAFEKGLLLLHSFEYDDAREAFLEAQTLDSNMAMAYWGESMTYNHSLWNEQDYDEAVSALHHLEKIDLTTITQLEQDLIEAAKILYQPKTEKNARDVAYSDFMAGLTKKYRDNHEVAAFYALSLLGSVPDGRDDVLYGKGAKIAKGILAENPNHPGALHYLIHSYDDPSHASLALEAANTYAKVAPDASHALHMPSHIYVAMGMWDEVISSNINSYDASVTRMREKNLNNDARGYHAYHWLQYGYLQKGNKEEAKKMVDTITKYVTQSPSKRGRVHQVFLKGTYLVETNDWEGEVANIPVSISDLNIAIRSQYHFLEGMKNYKKGNLKKLDSILEVMDKDHQRESFVVAEGSAKLCSSVTRDEATESDLKESQIRQLQLQALKADLQKNVVLAEKLFQESIALDKTLSYNFGPPSIQKPTYELYADWLLLKNRKEEAAAAYTEALTTGPGRLHIRTGIEKAQQL
ncbi:hypothetical protein ATE92_1239 [Ulvibacter sp. MAR_2010_11]|uniref:tetratricopeptide repeat protein n=1 Tax=Ulvibacter sp. MAR_2010_11 TaxID=1250229 RepID=UPI000C2CE0D1|nr:hypothetical protein [Ulvibacter sp. MAR_2010_11]PKA83093.1 hypothetical protein ATE92_1239 [Ulvibacter sp. MAR_2010_11]